MGTSKPRGLSRRDFLKTSGTGLAGAVLLGAAGCGGGGKGGGATVLYFTAPPDESGTTAKLIDDYNHKNKGCSGSSSPRGQRGHGAAPGQAQDPVPGRRGRPGCDPRRRHLDRRARRERLGIRHGGPLSRERPAEVPARLGRRHNLDGKPYAMPWFTDTGLLYYRKDLLKESGYDALPKTWDELKTMARRVREKSGTKFGFVFQGARYEGGVCDGCEYIWGNGGDVLDPEDPSRVIVDSPQAIAGLATERSMITDGVSPKAVSVYKEDESAGAFLNGDAVFLRQWPYVYALTDPKQSKIKPEQGGVSELPSSDGRPGNGTVGDQPLYISTSSKYPDAAWKFIEFLSAPEQQKFRAVKASYLPTRTALYEDAEIQESVPVIALAREALQHTRPRPVSPYYSDMSLEMQEQFNASLLGDLTPEEAARTLKKNLENLIQQGQGS